MSAIPYMPLYVADYLADAAHLTTEEHGAYLLLIMTYWQRGKPLPADPERLARIARMSSERWTDVEQTLSEFFTVIDGGWHHKRIDAELEKVRDKSAKAKRAGVASANTRKATSAQQPSNERSTDAQQTFNHTDTDTDTDTEEREKSARAQSSEHFEVCQDILDNRAADLDQWEIDFLISIKPKSTLSKAQSESLKGIQAKLGPRTGKPHALPSVKRGSPAYDAWIGYYRAKNGGRATFHEGRDALTVPSEFPPVEQAA